MEVTAKLRYLRIAPRKVREVADLIRGERVERAQALLEFLVKKSAKPVSKLLKGAIASAYHNFKLEQSNLYISKILVDEGPKLKRWRASSRGRSSRIIKRTSHITIILDEIKKSPILKKGIKKSSDKRKPFTKITKEVPKEKSKAEQARHGADNLSAEKVKFKQDKKEIHPGKSAKGGTSPKDKQFNRAKRPQKEIGLKRIFKRKAF